ncbi:unnamed protein product [Adineta steineri]|uniref:Methyltransferase domain-containing protein n=1 Tax=Adineta steineri TaxID=433720 RepID=A0A814KPU4_9BILA|nr:unnamed protein product [Adineta steineri]CAF1052633.1 unnamed protein product [Adineta steineri]CAF1119885.1 unnamed protein product [Adineta steineri]
MSATSYDQHETKTVYYTPATASKYVNNIFMSPLNIEWISSLICDSLELQPGHILVDMGCGVDPSQGMLDVFQEESGSNSNIKTVCMDAVTFGQSTNYSPYDRIFMKTMIHLLTREERLIAFKGFYKHLAPNNGKLLICRNPDMLEILPFDERTKSFFAKGEHLETLLDDLKHAGFKQIQEKKFTFEYPSGSVTAEDWIYLVQNRLWTVLSKENVNEQQMEDLIDHVRR